MFALANLFTISPIVPFAFILFMLLAPTAFYKNKNLMLETPGLAIGKYFITNSIFIILIYDQLFIF